MATDGGSGSLIDISLIDLNLNFVDGGDTDTFLRALAAVGRVLNGQIEDVYQSLGRQLDQQATDQSELDETLERIVGAIILDQDTRINRVVWDAANAITRWHENRETATKEDVSASTDTISAVITEALSSVVSGHGSLTDHVTREASRVISENTKTLNYASDSLTDSIGQSNSLLGSILEAVTGAGETVINNTIQIPNDILDGVLREVRGLVNDQLAGIADDLERNHGIIGEIIGESIVNLGHSIPDTQDELHDIASVLRRLADSAERSVNQSRDFTDGSTFSGVLDSLFAGGAGLESDGRGGLRFAFKSVDADDESKGEFERCEATMRKFMGLPTGILGLITDIFVGLLAFIRGPLAIANMDNARIMRTARLCYSDQIPDLGILARGVWYRDWSATSARILLQQTGITPEQARSALKTQETLLTAWEYVSAWLRGVIDKDKFRDKLSHLGYQRDERETIESLAFFIPPVQDLITMAVREAFTPSIVASNKALEDLPEAFVENAQKQGVSREWAERYWAAHWVLPSPQMGFEMLHRGVINSTDLDLLLRQLDIMPAWRERLRAISYRPLTRVDVRRMHAMGVIDRAAVTKAYKDIGYNDANAELMTQFTEAYNQSASQATTEDPRDLTRSSIMGFYDDGVIDRKNAKQYLEDIGYTSADAEMYLEAADLDAERKERAAEVDAIIVDFRTGLKTRTGAERDIRNLPLAPVEMAKALTALKRAAAAKTKIPSLADLGKFYAGEIISDAEYVAGIEALGYNRTWAARYLQLANLEE